MKIAPGTVLWGRYEVMESLGESILGHLWRCRDRKAGGKDIVLRWLPPDLRLSKVLVAIIHASIRRIANSTHPNVSSIRQMVYVGSEIYLIGDYCPGESLRDWMRNGGTSPRPLSEVLPIMEQIASALDFVHEKGVCHGNLTPANVFIDSDGVVRVSSFGLVPRRHTTVRRGDTSSVEFGASFRAPEFKSGGEIDSASDQYSMAAIARWMCAGGETSPDDKKNVAATSAVLAELPPAARGAFRRALNPRPRKRYVTCMDFIRALRGERVSGHRRRTAAEWKRLGLWVTSIVATALTLAVGWGVILIIAEVLNQPIPVIATENGTQPISPHRAKSRGRRVLPLVATTPLPEEGKPWVATTVPMEFVWVFEMQMWVGRFEVTNEEYRKMNPEHNSGRFCSPKGMQMVSLNGIRQPAVTMNFAEAYRYARWLTQKERAEGKLRDDLVYRLPSQEEASQYIRAGKSTIYPWGETLPPTMGNYADSSLKGTFFDMPVLDDYRDGAVCTAEVTESGENAWGIFGAGGNVWETVTREPGGSSFGGWQGGGWDDYTPARLQSDARYGFMGDAHGVVNGFRLVLAHLPGKSPAAPAQPAPATAKSDSPATASPAATD